MRQSDGRRGDYPFIDLDRRLRDAEQRLRQIPSRFAGGATASRKVLRIVDGNIVETTVGILGIKYSATKISTVAAIYDLSLSATLPDGLGRAELWTDGVLTGYVLVVNSLGYGSPVAHVVVAGYHAETWGAQATLTLASDPTQSMTAYVMRMVA